jgi:hypothetical protein
MIMVEPTPTISLLAPTDLILDRPCELQTQNRILNVPQLFSNLQAQGSGHQKINQTSLTSELPDCDQLAC